MKIWTASVTFFLFFFNSGSIGTQVQTLLQEKKYKLKSWSYILDKLLLYLISCT